MTWVSLQMVSCLGSLLVLTHRASVAAHIARRCIHRRHWDKLNLHNNHNNAPPPPQPQPQPGGEDKRTYAQAGGEVNERSLAPWRYRVDRDVDRIPRDISIAECLCRGCMLNQREDLSYNSVPVMVQVMVLRKTQCPTDKDKYLLTIDSIKVPVACVCVVPKSNK